MWLDGIGSARDINGNLIDELKILRELDADSMYFPDSFTGRIWTSLELGNPYSDNIDKLGDDEIDKITKEYAKKHKPIPLKNLIKSKATMP
jgi:hypothetical protein